MPAGRYNTMAEGLQKMAQDCAVLFATPDADLQFLSELQTMILAKMREPIDAVQQAQGGQPGQMPSSGAGGVAGPPPEIAALMGGQMPAQGIPSAASPPGGPGAGAPNPDEVRRMLQM